MDDLPITRYALRLRLTEPARFHFLHGGVARGLLSRALERHDLPPGVIPATPESGRVRFAAGEPYHLGITLAGEHAALAPALLDGLDRLGRQRPSGPAPPTLAGNFHLEAADELPPPDLAAEAAALAGAPHLTLQFLSPLRLERPEPAKQRGAGFLDDRCFPPEPPHPPLGAPGPPAPRPLAAAPRGATCAARRDHRRPRGPRLVRWPGAGQPQEGPALHPGWGGAKGH